MGKKYVSVDQNYVSYDKDLKVDSNLLIQMYMYIATTHQSGLNYYFVLQKEENKNLTDICDQLIQNSEAR